MSFKFNPITGDLDLMRGSSAFDSRYLEKSLLNGGTTNQVLTKNGDGDLSMTWSDLQSHTHPVGDITADGTLDSSTFLRGDGVWEVPLGSAHNEKPDLQGGTTDEYYHLTSAELSNIHAPGSDDQTLNSLLPDQTDNSGKHLTTDGTDASWTIPVITVSDTNPTGIEGLLYYNTTQSILKIYHNDGWINIGVAEAVYYLLTEAGDKYLTENGDALLMG